MQLATCCYLAEVDVALLVWLAIELCTLYVDVLLGVHQIEIGVPVHHDGMDGGDGDGFTLGREVVTAQNVAAKQKRADAQQGVTAL